MNLSSQICVLDVKNMHCWGERGYLPSPCWTRVRVPVYCIGALVCTDTHLLECRRIAAVQLMTQPFKILKMNLLQ